MNEVYTKLGEMTNAMRNLHELLELGKALLFETCSDHFQGKKTTSWKADLKKYAELLRNE